MRAQEDVFHFQPVCLSKRTCPLLCDILWILQLSCLEVSRGLAAWNNLSICAALILLIGPSRIYLGEHWASDVIGSYIIGTFWLIILISCINSSCIGH